MRAKPLSDPAAKTDSLSDRAHAAIRRDIVSGVLPPGEAVSELALSVRYGFGKAPVRSALSRLRQEGLVDSSPRRSCAVSAITLRDVHEVYELRALLEPAGAQRAAGRVDIDMLRAIDAECRTGYAPGDAASTLRFLEGNRRFHLTIAEAAGNLRIVRLLAQALDETTRVMTIGLAQRDRNAEMAHEHHELLQALACGDGEAAADIARQQVLASRDMVIGALLRSPGLLDRPIA